MMMMMVVAKYFSSQYTLIMTELHGARLFFLLFARKRLGSHWGHRRRTWSEPGRLICLLLIVAFHVQQAPLEAVVC
jgi:hypothetical protein